jgi:hypothetical protein
VTNSFRGLRTSAAGEVSRPLVLLLIATALSLLVGKAEAQYAYFRHPDALAEGGETVPVLAANPNRAFVYCVIASPGKGEPLAQSVVKMGNAMSAVPVQYPGQPSRLWANTGAVWVFSDQWP